MPLDGADVCNACSGLNNIHCTECLLPFVTNLDVILGYVLIHYHPRVATLQEQQLDVWKK